MSTVHVVPRRDLIEHDTGTTEPDCICGPDVVPINGGDGVVHWRIDHHSLDGREGHE